MSVPAQKNRNRKKNQKNIIPGEQRDEQPKWAIARSHYIFFCWGLECTSVPGILHTGASRLYTYHTTSRRVSYTYSQYQAYWYYEGYTYLV